APSPPSPKLQEIDLTGDQLSKVAAPKLTGWRTVAAAGIDSEGNSGPAPSKPAAWMIVLAPSSLDQTEAPSPGGPSASWGSVALAPSSDSSVIGDQAPAAGSIRPSITVGLAPERAQTAAALPLGSIVTSGVTTVWVSPAWVRSCADRQAVPAALSADWTVV